MTRRIRIIPIIALLAACATIREVVQPPRFDAAADRRSELRILAPSAERPVGGAALRLWARVENPNPFGLTITDVAGDLFLEDTRAAEVDLPLGLPLEASRDTVIPLDVTLDFSDLPGLADAAASLLARGAAAYRLDGTFTVDATPLGRPSFGPQTLLRGTVDVLQ